MSQQIVFVFIVFYSYFRQNNMAVTDQTDENKYFILLFTILYLQGHLFLFYFEDGNKSINFELFLM